MIGKFSTKITVEAPLALLRARVLDKFPDGALAVTLRCLDAKHVGYRLITIPDARTLNGHRLALVLVDIGFNIERPIILLCRGLFDRQPSTAPSEIRRRALAFCPHRRSVYGRQYN
jgi:hypothetical protein